MPTSDGRSRRRSESKLADDPRRRGNRHQQLRGPLCRRPVFRRLAACCWFSFCVLGATNVAAKTQGADGATVGRGQRAGSIAGLVEGRISLANVTKMLTSSVHMELAGSEDAFRHLLDREWEQISVRPAGTRSTFLVCSEAGRKNAKRLRELAGAPSLVETLYHHKGEPLCSVASLDKEAAELVAADGGGETFSVEPMPHLAKLAPAVAVDPSQAALLLSSEAASAGDEGTGARASERDGGSGGGRGRRNLRAGEAGVGDGDSVEAGVSAEQRARVLAAAVAERPATHRLIDDGVRGRVDAIEITLVLHHERRSKSETQEIARRWLSVANDQASLAKVLREKHFWGKGREAGVGGIGEEGNGEGRRLAEEEGEAEDGEESTAEEGQERARECAAHEERKRLGWAGLLDSLDKGQSAGGRKNTCGFDLARFTVSPNGKKVLLHRPHEMAAAAAERRGAGAAEDDGCLSALLAFLSLQPEVHYVTARRRSATMNLDAAWVTQSGVDGVTSLWDEDLQGQDEIIGVADTGVDLNHCHFIEDDGDSIEASDWEDPITDLTKRKVVQYIDYVDDFDEAGGHGTHVAGSLVGAQSGEEAGDHEADGMAFQGQIAVFDFGDSLNNNALTTPDQVDEIMLQPAYDAGARVHSNSWDTVSVEYTSISKEVDEFVYTHQDFLVVFAAGNCGDTSATDDLVDNCDALDDDEGTVLSPAQAKNVVAVGSSESGGVADKDIDTVSYFSSKGPTIDGRIKPDVVAPGDPTWSAYADPTDATCEFGTQTGTSMATPVVAGNAAMARQYFREGWYNTGSKNLTLGFEPSAALLKAVLVNSATGMSFAGVNPEASSLDVTLTDPPDKHQGHGRVTMINALNINATVGLFFKDWVEISEGETLEYEVSLYEDADLDKDLRVSLVWTDPAASTGSTSALIHDLDLVVIAQSTGTTYYPNGADEADTVNNVEKIIITDTTELETYTIQVSCDDLSEADTQYFAVVANGEFIKTNDLPTTPEPSDWLDLVDQAAANILTWKFGVILVLSFAACLAVSCACRRWQRNRRHNLLQSKYRRAIVANRGTVPNGRKVRPPSARPQPYTGPLRAPSERPGVPGRLEESWRRPGPGSTSGRSVRSLRSMRSEQSSRGALLTNAGAEVPTGLYSKSTTPPTPPPNETCPECGLRLPDVIQLVKHVETKHGGRAIRKQEAAAALPGGTAAASRTVAARSASPAVASSKDPRRLSPAERKTTSPDVRAVEAKPRARSSGRSGHTSAVRSAAAAGAGVAAKATAVAAAPKTRGKSAAPTSRPRSRSPSHGGSSSKASSQSPGISGSGSGGSGSGRSGSSSSKHGSKSSGGSGRQSGAERGRDALPRVKDASRHGSGKDARRPSPDAANDATPAHDGEPRILRASRRSTPAAAVASQLPATNPDRRRGSPATAAVGRRGDREDRVARSPPPPYAPELGIGGSGSGGSRERSRHSADKGNSSVERRRGGGDGGRKRGSPDARGNSKRPVRENSAKSLTRTTSLDRLSALSSRAISRPSGQANTSADSSGGGRGRIRRMSSTEDMVGQRLTADKLQMLGSGRPADCTPPPPVFSPVTKTPSKPAYSPVARARAGELDEERPVSLRKKFFRQLSGEL